jgi:hypothetical protein
VVRARARIASTTRTPGSRRGDSNSQPAVYKIPTAGSTTVRPSPDFARNRAISLHRVQGCLKPSVGIWVRIWVKGRVGERVLRLGSGATVGEDSDNHRGSREGLPPVPATLSQALHHPSTHTARRASPVPAMESSVGRHESRGIVLKDDSCLSPFPGSSKSGNDVPPPINGRCDSRRNDDRRGSLCDECRARYFRTGAKGVAVVDGGYRRAVIGKHDPTFLEQGSRTGLSCPS